MTETTQAPERHGERTPFEASKPMSGRVGKRYPRRLVFLPILASLIVMWNIVAAFTMRERSLALERAQSQLGNAVSTLVELSVLAERAAQIPAQPGDLDNAAALWHILLEYPSAWIWIETDGKISVGQPAPSDTEHRIVVTASSGNMIAHAALADVDALGEWRRSVWQRAVALLVVSTGFLILADRLSRELIKRAAAEHEAVAAAERVTQLNHYRVQLEETVAQRTVELQQANLHLEQELAEKMAAVSALHQHDALLTTVTKGAAALLGERELNDAILAVLALIGPITSVERVDFATFALNPAGHLISSIRQEWCNAGVTRLMDSMAFKDLDLTELFPAAAVQLAAGQQSSLYIDDLSGLARDLFVASGRRSVLLVPIRIGQELSGSLNFSDSVPARRTWTWAETDTLATLAGLVSSAITRAQRIKELADANMIVQNSPTILFRLRGEPSLPLIYISQNIEKFGHSPTELVASPAWPVILVDPDDRSKVLSALTKVLDNGASSASIEFRLMNGDGSRRWVEARYSPVRDKIGRLSEIEGIMIDVTERKAAEERIVHLARTDPLTGLANRSTFTERLHLAFSASRRGGPSFAVLYLDLDHFKDVNDTLGHPIGDLLLQAMAARLLSGVREIDLVARLGGDEFAILQTDVSDPTAAGALAEKLRIALDQPYTLKGNVLNMTASLGVAPLVADTIDADTMLAQADLALYRAKEEGRDQYCFHTKDLDDEVRERVSLTADLRQAIEHSELELYYQPQVDLATGMIVGIEALARWHHPTRGLIMPSVFISIAEKTGAILPLGRWVLDEACGQMRKWRDDGIAPPVVAVNVSMLQLRNAQDFIREVTGALAKWGLAADNLELDVTESILAQISWTRNDVLTALRKMGVCIALDNFGTEYSSFDYLRKYQVSHIKIAQSFITTATDNPEHAQTIRAIIGLAHELQIDVIAEGVETADERALLLSIGSTTKGQGYYFSAAVNATQASQMLRKGMINPAPASPSVGPAPSQRSPGPLTQDAAATDQGIRPGQLPKVETGS